MYKPDWFEAAKMERANEYGVSEIGGWCAGLGIASTGGGQSQRMTRPRGLTSLWSGTS